jgi:iron complex outermembrane receptor protein
MKQQYKLLTTLFCGIFLLSSVLMNAQRGAVEGQISDSDGSLYGATVLVMGTTNGTTTDFDGRYTIALDPGNYTLEISYIGYSTTTAEVTVGAGQTVQLNVLMTEGVLVDEVVVVGSRSVGRTKLETPVPVDVIDIAKLSSSAPQTNLNQLLHQSVPSFSSNTQTISDGTDHIDPASLRGLGPDQVLVLMNGKRRHTSSLVNVNGTFGRGSVGTDLNAIPASAVKTIEVLRDGAAAQYGSDAIAGVINLRLKNDVNKLSFNVTTGANLTSEIGAFEGEKKDIDGENVTLGVNYGLPLGNNGGFINVTGEYGYRGSTNRMLEWEGSIFSAYNGIERVASAAGADVSALTLSDVQNYAGSVGYFSPGMISEINAASSLADISGVLGTNVTDEELAIRGQQRSDYNMRVGQSETKGGQFFANMSVPLGDKAEIYSFGGIGYRNGESGCFYRLPNQDRTSTSIYPNGVVPRINSNIKDKSIAAGIKGEVQNWNVDFSNTYGSNEFLYYMTMTHNATLGPSSPTEFNVGGHIFTQNTTNFDVGQYFENVGSLAGINVAFGAEYRYENYLVEPGSELSYGKYENSPTDILGRARPAGAQCFAGFIPENVVDANRSSVAGYLDTEFDITKALLIAGAVRFEDYSDFGSTFNYKIAGRYTFSDNFVVRGAHSTGFRAPSLHQISYSKTSTLFALINGVSVAQESGVFANTSRAAKLLGIPKLKEETSQNFSLGFTAKFPSTNLKLTLDAYQVNIVDRVILTGAFSAGNDAELQRIFDDAGATEARFFTNAIDTRSQGIDVVLSHRVLLGNGKSLTNDLAGTFSRTEWDQDAGIKASPLLIQKGLVGNYFNQESRLYLEQAVPRTKVTLSNTFALNKATIYLRNTYFGETTEATNEALFNDDLDLLPGATIDPYNSPKVITDLSLGYAFSSALSVTIGANNLLDVYPDKADPAFRSEGRFEYSRRSPQFSFGGRHVFARLAFTLK